MAQITIDQLIKQNYIIAFAEIVKINDEEEQENIQEEISYEKKEEILNLKRYLVDYFLKGLKLADSIG